MPEFQATLGRSPCLRKTLGSLVDELEELQYVEREPDPRDRRAKLIVLTPRGRACVAAGVITIDGVEDQIRQALGETGHRRLRELLQKLLDAG